ncbi:MAG TPA: signal transduction protein, partial [Nitrospira sp.]|nr:signal transduction protein [Nitrospira sp.]
MASTRIASKKPRPSLDRSIERMRKHLAELAVYVKKGKASRTLEEFDSDSERLIAELLGETSALLDAYQYAQLGEAAGLVNMTEEAPESIGLDSERQSLLQRTRV